MDFEAFGDGKTFDWNEPRLDILLKKDYPIVAECLGNNKREEEMRRWKDWNAYMDLPDGARPGSINKNRQYYFIKIFCDNYCLIKALYESPKFIGMVSPNLEQLMWDN